MCMGKRSGRFRQPEDVCVLTAEILNAHFITNRKGHMFVALLVPAYALFTR
jgi:hypothetical protein